MEFLFDTFGFLISSEYTQITGSDAPQDARWYVTLSKRELKR